MKKSTDESIKEAVFEKGAAKKRKITLAMLKDNLSIDLLCFNTSLLAEERS